MTEAVIADAPLRRSPLHSRHLTLGAKLADFGGWQMPIEYPDGGVLKEHQAVRQAVGLFDVSHLGKARVTGPGSAAYLNATLTNDLAKIGPGRAQYTMCCDDATGGVVDDLIVYQVADDDLLLVPNAANTAEVVRRLAASAPRGVTVEDAHESYGVLALQGPRSGEVIERLGLPADHPYMSFVVAGWGGSPVVVCRSGYTGEKGYELLPRWEDTAALWDAVLAAGADLGIRPCGLGARDTLRTEMGYPLHGHELSLDITPVQARAGWAVGWSKPAFWGRDALVAEKAAGPVRVLRGLDGLDRGIPRLGMAVLPAAGGPPGAEASNAEASNAEASDPKASGADASGLARDPVGVVTSGTFSPTLRRGIALALVDRGVGEGDEVVVDVRGRPSRFRVVRPPFVETSTA